MSDPKFPVVYNTDTSNLEYSQGVGFETPLPEGPATAISSLTGDVTTATGPGAVAATLATVNSNVGSFTNASITVNGKGLVTAASSGSAIALPSVVDSSSTSGGAAQEEVTVAGLLTTSTIWSVTQVTPGGAVLPLLGWTNVLAGSLNLIYSADMGVGAVVRVVFVH